MPIEWGKPLRSGFLVVLLLVATVFVLFVLLFRTGKYSTQIYQDSPEATKTYNLGSYQEKSSVTGSLVSGFPDIPVYPKAQLLESKSYDEDGGVGYLAKYQANDQLISIFTWYKKELTKGGWEISTEPDNLDDASSFLLGNRQSL